MDFYIILGLARDATVADVKKAYRRLARRYHPDVNPGDQRSAVHFREIAEAYAILSDPERRRRYDQVGYEPVAAEDAATGFEGFDFSAAVHANQQSTFGDLFADVFRGEPLHVPGPERGADLHATLSLTFEQAMKGGEFRVAVLKQATCKECAGTGVRSIASARCPACDGVGTVRSARGHMVFTRPCGRCRGTGVLVQQACTGCGGSGSVARSEPVTVTMPAGIHDGVRLRVGAAGNAGRMGGPPGDVYVTVHVAPHPLFRREGDELHLVVPVAVHEAALGSRIEIPGIDGPTRLRVPPGTQSGQHFRLRGRGAPSPRTGRRGDLVVEVRLMLPSVLDERSKLLLRELGMLNGESVRRDFDKAWRPPTAESREA
jgi:molecular chaperone DnaJ